MSSCVVEARSITKDFRVAQKPGGRLSTLRHLVRRRYRTVRAVDGVSFSIRHGERVAVLGANGAGKTTLVKLMCGLLRPSAGQVELLGTEPIRRRIAVRRQMGLVLAGRVRLWPELTANDNFELLYALYGLDAAAHAGRTARLAELLGVAGDLQTQVRKLSFGTRTKLELMGGLLHAPRVVFLDEPTVGVDHRTREALHDFLGNDHPDGLGREAALVLTSHNLADITRIARRVLLIREGRLVYDGMLSDVVAAARESVRIKVRGRRLRAGPLPDARVIRDTPDELELAVHPRAVRRVLAAVTETRDVRDVRTDVPSAEEALDELYRHLG